MRVFCFVQLFHITERGGGAEVQANYLATELVNRGYKVHYICMSIHSNKVNTTSKINGVNVHWLPQKTSTAQENFRNIKNILLQLQPDYIIERMSSAYAWPILRAVKRNKAKYIWICTDNESPKYFRSLTNYYRKQSIPKFLYASKKAMQVDFIRMFANKKADIVFSQNNFQKNLIKRNFKRDSHKMISGHPIPEENISTAERFKNKTILWCANLGAHKRPELFVELAKRMKDTDLKFVMVGGHGNSKYVDQLFADKPENLTTTGRLSFDDALNYFDKATVFVNTSDPGGDGFPNTYVQAWLRSVPVLNFGFDPDNIVVNNDLGFSVTSIDEAEAWLLGLMNDYQSYNTLSQNVYNFGCQNHSIKVMTDNFLNCIEVDHCDKD